MRPKIPIIVLLAMMLIPGIVQGEELHCPKCNAVIQAETQFCGECGAVLVHSRTPEVEKPTSPNAGTIPNPGALDPSVQQLIGKLSEEDLRRIVVIMLERLESQQARLAPPPNSVAMMTRGELENLLKTYGKEVPVKKEVSSFGAFLQFIGGSVLFVIGILIIASF